MCDMNKSLLHIEHSGHLYHKRVWRSLFEIRLNCVLDGVVPVITNNNKYLLILPQALHNSLYGL